MNTYNIEISETTTKVVKITANTEKEALKQVQNMYENDEVNMQDEVYENYTIKLI